MAWRNLLWWIRPKPLSLETCPRAPTLRIDGPAWSNQFQTVELYKYKEIGAISKPSPEKELHETILCDMWRGVMSRRIKYIALIYSANTIFASSRKKRVKEMTTHKSKNGSMTGVEAINCGCWISSPLISLHFRLRAAWQPSINKVAPLHLTATAMIYPWFVCLCSPR